MESLIIKYNLVQIASVFLTALLISLTAIPRVIKMVNSKGFLDNPNERKSHSIPIPTLGGIGIYLGLIIPILIYCTISIQFAFTIVAISIVFLTGIVDDIYDIRALYKYGFQFLSALIICLSGLRLQSLYGLFGIYELGIFAQYYLTILFITGVTNAINLMDGVNGLVGGLFLINSLIISWLFSINNDLNNMLITLCFSGSILGFLKFNFNKAKIFMGDTGSMVIGFFMSIMILIYLGSSPSYTHNFSLLLALFILPIFDMVRLIITRILKGKSPFSADNNHVHHLLLKSGSNHMYVSVFLYVSHILLISLSHYFLKDLNITKSLFILVLSCIIIMEVILFKGFIFLKSLATENIEATKHKLIAKNLNKYEI